MSEHEHEIYAKQFKLFDNDQSGGLSRPELLALLLHNQPDCDIEKAIDLLKRFDGDQNGTLSLTDYIAMARELKTGSRAASTAPAVARVGAVDNDKSRLTRYFQKYNPANVAKIDAILAQFAGKEDQLWQQLIGKFGPEPPADGGSALPADSSAAESGPCSKLRESNDAGENSQDGKMRSALQEQRQATGACGKPLIGGWAKRKP